MTETKLKSNNYYKSLTHVAIRKEIFTFLEIVGSWYINGFKFVAEVKAQFSNWGEEA